MKPAGRHTKLLIVILSIFALIIVLGCLIYFWIITNVDFEEGMGGFFVEIGWRSVFGIAALVIGCILIRTLYLKGTGLKHVFFVILCVPVGILGIAAPYFLLKAPIMDLAYFNNYPTIYLTDLSYDMDSSGDTTAYYMRGDSASGENYS